MARVGIVVPVLSNFTGCVDMFASIRTKHICHPFILTQYRKQVSLSAAWNEGIGQVKEAGFDYALVVNDDILFSKYTIDSLVDFLENCDPQIVMITGCNVQGAFDNPLDILTWQDDELIESAKGNFSEHPDFSCMLFRPNLCELIGPFDENFYPAFVEDNEMHFRINLLGYKAGATSAAPYYHYGSITGKEVSKDEAFHDQFRKNQEYYEKKWGGYVGQEQFQHPYNFDYLTPKQWIINYWDNIG